MAIVISGTAGTISGISTGGLPDGCVDADTLGTDSVTAAKLKSDAITTGDLPSGSVLQVVNGSTSTGVATTTTGTYIDTGITATITPSSTSSKILVLVNICGIWRNSGQSYNRMGIRILRGSTAIGGAGSGNEALAQHWAGDTVDHRLAGAMYSTYDSPSTTSATTYKVQFQAEVVSSGTGLAVQKDSNSGESNIFLYEIAG